MVELDHDCAACCWLNLREKLIPLLTVIARSNKPIIRLKDFLFHFVDNLLLLFERKSFLELGQTHLNLHRGSWYFFFFSHLWKCLWCRNSFFLLLLDLFVILSLGILVFFLHWIFLIYYKRLNYSRFEARKREKPY